MTPVFLDPKFQIGDSIQVSSDFPDQFFAEEIGTLTEIRDTYCVVDFREFEGQVIPNNYLIEPVNQTECTELMSIRMNYLHSYNGGYGSLGSFWGSNYWSECDSEMLGNIVLK